MNTKESTSSDIRMQAMNLLAVREHSAKELYVKLAKKCTQDDLISAVIEKLQRDALQSDSRFAEAYTTMRLRQGKGAQMIRFELRERGVSDEIINACLSNAVQKDDWNILALNAYQKKFGDSPIGDLKEKAKRMRFLTARGFAAENIQYVFKKVCLHI